MTRLKVACTPCTEDKVEFKEAKPCANRTEKGKSCEFVMNDGFYRPDSRSCGEKDLICEGGLPRENCFLLKGNDYIGRTQKALSLKRRQKEPACGPCRRRKIKCVGKSAPCETCQKRGCPQRCEFSGHSPDDLRDGWIHKTRTKGTRSTVRFLAVRNSQYMTESRSASPPFDVISFSAEARSPNPKDETANEVDKKTTSSHVTVPEEAIFERKQATLIQGACDYGSFGGYVIGTSKGFHSLPISRFMSL